MKIMLSKRVKAFLQVLTSKYFAGGIAGGFGRAGLQLSSYCQRFVQYAPLHLFRCCSITFKLLLNHSLSFFFVGWEIISHYRWSGRECWTSTN